MRIVVYSTSHCPNCDAAKRLLESKGLQYEMIDAGFEPFMQDLLRRYPQARQMPQIFIDGQRVGGLAGLQQALKQIEGCQCPACKITPHASDCAVHNAPAEPAGACDCGGQA